ncbi:hypothetical protein KY284_000574 [Solanum tuberosum]|nr:hypothetical protein KY284_000574 [Solanum tuberosum]
MYVDGYSKGNRGSAGGGGVLRDYIGHMLMAFGAYFRCRSNNYVEAQAFKIGILVIQMIKDDIGQIQAMSTIGHFTFTHIFIEGNTMADMLGNFVEHSKMTTFFTEVEE